MGAITEKEKAEGRNEVRSHLCWRHMVCSEALSRVIESSTGISWARSCMYLC